MKPYKGTITFVLAGLALIFASQLLPFLIVHSETSFGYMTLAKPFIWVGAALCFVFAARTAYRTSKQRRL